MSNHHTMRFRGKVLTFTDSDLLKVASGIPLTKDNIVEESVMVALTCDWLDDDGHSALSFLSMPDAEKLIEFGQTSMIMEIMEGA